MMIRCFTTAALVTLALGASLRPALAQCANADQCTAQVCAERQSHIHPLCDQQRSCGNIASFNKAELRRRVTLNQQCLSVRQSVEECFSVVDAGHQQVIHQVQNALQVCQTKLDS